MDTREKLDLLSKSAELEAADTFASGAPGQARRDLYPCITRLAAPGGRSVPVLKVLQSNACRNNCHYCAFRAGRDYRRVRLSSDELARCVDLMHRSDVIQGLFLSSGIGDTVKTMDEMLATAELLRGRYGFRGYLHLKLLPGVEGAQVERAVELADRVSTNLEAPSQDRLVRLAPEKQMAQLVEPLRAAAGIIQRERLSRGLPHSDDSRLISAASVGRGRLGTSTQFVVGPAGETDLELLTTAEWLYGDLGLTRAYYSPFHPVAQTPLEEAPPTEGRRQQRLYQADWLLRYYYFKLTELPFDINGQLDATRDPKTVWAQRHPERFPVEVNRAPVVDLLRVPGIGPASACAIGQARRKGTLRTLGDLRRLGARADQAAPYVVLAGHRPPWQLRLSEEW